MKRAFLLLALAVPAHADRFNVTFEGKSLDGSEVCAFRAGEASSPITRFFGGGPATTCYRAERDVRLPPGTWNVYARRGAELISDATVLVVAGEGKPHDLRLVRAATVDTTAAALHPDEALWAYVVATGDVIPINPTVPATRIVPLIATGPRIRAIGDPITPAAGQLVRVAFRSDAAQSGSVVVPVTIGSPPKGKFSPPKVTLGAAQQDARALVFFRGVAAGAHDVKLAGDRWTTVTRPVKVIAGEIAVADPIVARPGSKLRVHWWTPVAPASLAQPERECGARPTRAAKSPSFRLDLLECPDQKPGGTIEMVARESCTVVAGSELPADAAKGVVELRGIAAGLYFVRVTHPGLPPFFQSISVGADDTSDADVEIRYVTFFGKVTRAAKPLHVRVFGTVTDSDTGEYTAVLTRLPKADIPIDLRPCDGGRAITLVPDDAPRENARFDIDVPDNHLTVHVVDAESRAPIEKAVINLAALQNGQDQAAHFAGFAGLTDADGRLMLDSVVENKRLHVCATRSDYENACADRFTFGGDAEKTIELALSRTVERRGRVVLDGPQQFASVSWYSPDGHLTEIAQVKEDGTFTYKRSHAAGEIVSYVSSNQPFIAFRQPPVAEEELFEIRPAAGARRRTFQVALSPQAREGAFVTIALGDMIIPADAFLWHVERHGAQPSLRPGWTANVPDVVESAPIRVILIPFSFAQAHDVRGVDIAMHPEVLGLPQQTLGERTRVDFP
jgi:hypothetical protein